MNTAISVSQESHLLNSLFGIEKPAISNILYKKNGYDLTLVQMLLALHAVEVAENVNVEHFEEDYLNSPIVNLTLTTAGAAGASKNFTIAPSGLYSGTNQFYAQVQDTVRFGNGVIGEITAIDVSTPSAPVLTIAPRYATSVIPAVAAGEQIAIISNRQNEVNGERKSAYRAPEKFSFPLQIISTTTSITGTAEAIRKWYDKYNTGEDARAFSRNIFNATYDHWMNISKAMWFESPTTNTSVVPTGQRGSMQGLIDWLMTSGAYVLPYTPGSFTPSTFRQIEAFLDKYFCNKQYIFAQGLGLARDTNDALNNTLASNSMSYLNKDAGSSFNSLLSGNMAQTDGSQVEFNVNSYKSNTRTFHFTSIPQFSDPTLNVTNSVGNPVGTDFLGVCIPIDKEKVNGSGMAKPTSLIKMRYLPRNNSKEYIRLSRTGANAPNQTNNLDEQTYHLLSDVGGEYFIPERWALVNPF